MPRVRAQLAIQAPPELLERLRAAAAAQRRTVTSLVVDWIEAGLSGGLPAAAPPAPAAGSDLLARVEALEAALAQLRPPASPERVSRAPRSGDSASLDRGSAPSPERVTRAPRSSDPLPLPDRRLTPAEAAGLLPLPDVAAALGLASGSALTNWIKREAGRRGGSAVGGVYRGHRLRGKGLLPQAQKPGWLWERVEA